MFALPICSPDARGAGSRVLEHKSVLSTGDHCGGGRLLLSSVTELLWVAIYVTLPCAAATEATGGVRLWSRSGSRHGAGQWKPRTPAWRRLWWRASGAQHPRRRMQGTAPYWLNLSISAARRFAGPRPRGQWTLRPACRRGAFRPLRRRPRGRRDRLESGLPDRAHRSLPLAGWTVEACQHRGGSAGRLRVCGRSRLRGALLGGSYHRIDSAIENACQLLASSRRWPKRRNAKYTTAATAVVCT